MRSNIPFRGIPSSLSRRSVKLASSRLCPSTHSKSNATYLSGTETAPSAASIKRSPSVIRRSSRFWRSAKPSFRPSAYAISSPSKTKSPASAAAATISSGNSPSSGRRSRENNPTSPPTLWSCARIPLYFGSSQKGGEKGRSANFGLASKTPRSGGEASMLRIGTSGMSVASDSLPSFAKTAVRPKSPVNIYARSSSKSFA